MVLKYLLIWDIDGTLIRIKGLGKKAMNITFMELYGISDAFNKINMAGMLDAVILKTIYDMYHIDAAKRDSAAFFKRYCEVLDELFKQISFSVACAGVPELLAALDEAGCFCNVLGTGNIERGARIKLSVDGLNKLFPTGGFGDEEMERWQLVEKAVANACKHFKIQFDSSNIFVVGDTPKDVACGKKLGFKTIAVATGPFSTAELHECGADFVFEDLNDKDKFLRIFGVGKSIPDCAR